MDLGGFKVEEHKIKVVNTLDELTHRLLPKMYLTEMQELQYLLFKVAKRLDEENEVILGNGAD